MHTADVFKATYQMILYRHFVKMFGQICATCGMT